MHDDTMRPWWVIDEKTALVLGSTPTALSWQSCIHNTH
jgi:hypothetical protein